MRLLLKSISLFSGNVFKINKIHLKNFASVLTQQQVTVPHHETLTGRILLYLNVDKEQQPPVPRWTSETLKNVLENENELQKLSTKELMTFTSHLTEQNLTKKESQAVIKELDNECYLRLKELRTPDILNLLNVYVSLVPSQITRLKFYKHSVKILFESLQTLSKKDQLQLIFYIGLKKKSLEAQTMLRQCMRAMDKNFINSLSSEDLCIICNATFKTSTKVVNKHLLEKIKAHINNNLSVLSDLPLFVTLVKTLRHNRCQNDDLLSSISCTIFFNKTFTLYSFPIICHILALYADYFFYDEKLLKMFTKKCLEQLNESSFVSKETHPAEQLRGKDIKRFLWITSMFSEMKLLDHGDIKNVIIPKLLERIEEGEFNGDVDSLVDITLYLWMLNYQATELVPYFLNKKTFNSLTKNPRTNFLRLNLLLHLMKTENPDLVKDFPAQASEKIPEYCSTFQLNKRPFIQKLLNNLERVRNKLNLKSFKLERNVSQMNILGITGYRNDMSKAVHIEVLDEYTRLRSIGDDVPVGLMALKLRLLDQSDEGVLVVSQREVEEMKDAELRNYLLEEIKLIC